MARKGNRYQRNMQAIVKAKRAQLDAQKEKPLIVPMFSDDMDAALGAMNNPGKNGFAVANQQRERASELKEAGGVDDIFLEELRKLGAEQDAKMEFEEQLRQLGVVEDIHGTKAAAAFLDPSNPSRTIEQQIGRRLVQEGLAPSRIPADRILGENMPTQMLGVDGLIKPDSEVRRHATGRMAGDLLEVDRSDVYTEFMSPRGRKEAFEDWAGNANMGDTSLRKFNQDISEYYGQQALKVKGATPVPDEERSKRSIQAAQRGNPASPVGTDRLIENSRALSDQDVDLSADFRYLDKDGNLMVGDNQTAEIHDHGMVNFNVLKNSNLNGIDQQQLRQLMAAKANDLQNSNQPVTLDNILGKMIEDGELSPLVRGSREAGTRAGKAMSGQPIMGEMNQVDQFRYDSLVYPMYKPGAIYQDEGYLPEMFRVFKTDNVNKAAGQMLANPNHPGISLFQHHGDRGDLQAAIKILGKPEGYLDADLNRQFSQGYSFGGNAVAREAGLRDPSFDDILSEAPVNETWNATGPMWGDIPF